MREVHSDVVSLLMNNEPFQYAHLIKFERPSRPDALSGKASTSAFRYVYLTDASRDVDFNDLSKDLNGVSNGTQTYVANKVLQVSTVSETIEATASNFTVTLDGNGLGAVAVTDACNISTVNSTTWDIAGFSNLIEQGFREGDKITLSGDREGSFNIVKFRANGVIRVSKIDDDLSIGVGLPVTISLSSEEIKSLLMNKNASEYSSFINREVYIYRAYFKNGVMVGETPDSNGYTGPILLFKGIISNVSFDDENGVKVQWGLTSHWGDFDQVKGRITSDEFHRALDQNGIPQPDSALKNAYAYDKGFMHADTSINILSTYSVQVEKQDVKAKSGFLGLGIGAKVKVKKYYVTEGRNTNLDFQLAAKALPVVYGVRKVEGIPIFADTLKNDSSTVYVLTALSEGPIGGIYDVVIEDKSLICNDKADSDARSKQTTDNTVDVICRGRADRGDVLGGLTATNTSATSVDYYDSLPDSVYSGLNFNASYLTNYSPRVSTEYNATIDNIGAGVIDGETISLTSPQEISLTFYAGTESQKADSELVQIAQAGNFKVQTDYWTGKDTAEYWGPNHRLLDTAYIVQKYKIKEGETTIPTIYFIIKGKSIDCYNYDYSYTPLEGATQDPANFPLGSIVTIKNTATNAVLNSNVQIIDKWRIIRADGKPEYRFRFSAVPALGYNGAVPTITSFHMENGSGQKWYMNTFNHVVYSAVLDKELSAPVTAVIDTGGNTSFTVDPSTATWIGVGGSIQGSPGLSLYQDAAPINNEIYGNAIMVGSYSTGRFNSKFNYDLSGADSLAL